MIILAAVTDQPDQHSASVLAGLARFGSDRGLGGEPGELLDPEVIEAFVCRGLPGRRSSTKGTYRSRLSRLGERRGLVATSRGTPFAGAGAPAPYSRSERAELEAIALAQPSGPRGPAALVLLSAGIGAGLRQGELVALCREDVSRRGEEVHVVVRARPSRVVPVRAPYGDLLTRLAEATGSGVLFRPGLVARSYKNACNDLCRHLVGDPGATRLSAGRCRSSFICDHLAQKTPLRRLLHLAAIAEVESLLRYCRHVCGAPQSKAALRAQCLLEAGP